MSYLNPIRLHFSGRFQADPSTVNNDVRHFNNATFKPEFRQPQTAPEPWNGWWEPEGSGAYRLVGCTVNAVYYPGGRSSPSDPVVGMAIADANARVAGKIVDLDPQQQVVSQIWGLIVRLTDGQTDFFSGPFDVASFSDMWGRAQGNGSAGDIGAGAFWQSVIGPVMWGDTSGSPFLKALKAAAPENLLSIKFNVDGYNMDPTSAAFTMGRIVGTIGPASLKEPRHFVVGRQLLPQVTTQQSQSGPGNPTGSMYFMQAVVDTSTRRVLADFGNALPTDTPGGGLANVGDLELGYLDASDTFESLGAVDYLQLNWYPTTAGIQAFPPDRVLTDAELAALAQNRVAVAKGGTPIVQENFDGLYLRADTFTFRVEPNAAADVYLWAAQYGTPLPNAQILVYADSSGLQAGGGDPDPKTGLGQSPAFATPSNVIAFPATLQTDAQGRATLTIAASDPGNPRVYIDGQVYGVRYLLGTINRQFGQPLPPPPDVSTWSFGYDPWDFVSLLVFDTYPMPDPLTWYALQPIWQQYANLYPIMSGLVNLASYDDVAAHANLLAFAFALPKENSNHMPVTRDLSNGKRAAILRWLTDLGPDGKPLRGQPSVPLQAVAAPAERPSAVRPASAADARKGAKAYAMSQRPASRKSDNVDEKK
jgi:hypothetical protein